MKITIDLPKKQVIIMKFLVRVMQLARSNSDLVVQMLNDYLLKHHIMLSDLRCWKELLDSFNLIDNAKINDIFNEANKDIEGD